EEKATVERDGERQELPSDHERPAEDGHGSHPTANATRPFRKARRPAGREQKDETRAACRHRHDRHASPQSVVASGAVFIHEGKESKEGEGVEGAGTKARDAREHEGQEGALIRTLRAPSSPFASLPPSTLSESNSI